MLSTDIGIPFVIPQGKITDRTIMRRAIAESILKPGRMVIHGEGYSTTVIGEIITFQINGFAEDNFMVWVNGPGVNAGGHFSKIDFCFMDGERLVMQIDSRGNK